MCPTEPTDFDDTGFGFAHGIRVIAARIRQEHARVHVARTYPVPPTAGQIAAARARLAVCEAGIDRAGDYTDDFGVWSVNRARITRAAEARASINALLARI